MNFREKPSSLPPQPLPNSAAPWRQVDGANVHNVARVIPLEGLLQDADGDEAHEFFVEDPKTGEMRQVQVTKATKATKAPR